MKILHYARYGVFLLLSLPLFLSAKTPKPKILIYGSTLEAYVAAVQSAASGVPTLWVNPQGYSFQEDRFRIQEALSTTVLDGGVVYQFIDKKSLAQDSIPGVRQNGKREAYNVLSPDNLLLTSLSNEDVVKIVRGKTWKVTLSNRKSYDFLSVLDASLSQDLLRKTSLGILPALKSTPAKDLTLAASRATVLLCEKNKEIYTYMLTDLFTQKDNFFVLDARAREAETNKAFQIAYGQTMGAIVSYCAFFKTTVDKIDLRTLQNELLTFRSRLLPAQDVSFKDQNFMSLQRMYLAGILPLHKKDEQLIFDGDDSVRVADIRPVINQFFTRAQLWFVDNNPEFMTVADALNLIKYTAFRGEELDVEVKRLWNMELTFKGDYNPSKVISRYEFAVLFDIYAAPFVKKVSQDGQTISR